MYKRFTKERVKVDNSGIIHLASRKEDWTNSFRISATLKEQVDRDTLQSTLAIVTPRFPTIAAGIQSDARWYYVMPIEEIPKVERDTAYLSYMTKEQINQCAFRVLYQEKQITVEIFHSLTDGYGGMIFLKTLVAEYLKQKYGVVIPTTLGVLDLVEKPKKKEIEDSFLVYGHGSKEKRSTCNAFSLHVKKNKNKTVHITTGIVKTEELLHTARKHGVSLTTFLTGVLMQSISEIQARQYMSRKKRRPIQVMIPVNLRKKFPSESLRNFTLYAISKMEAGKNQDSLVGLLHNISSQLKEQTNVEKLVSRMTNNVQIEKNKLVQRLPLKIKKIGIKVGFYLYGERNSCLTLSNLGNIQLPEQMKQYVQRMEFMLSPRLSTPYNCGVLSYNDKLIINFTRNCNKSELEQIFFSKIATLGHQVEVEYDGVIANYN